MTDGNLTVKCGYVTWMMWVLAAFLIVLDAVLMWAEPAPRVGPLSNCGIYLAAAAATFTVCASVGAVGRQILAELVRIRKDRTERDRIHALQ